MMTLSSTIQRQTHEGLNRHSADVTAYRIEYQPHLIEEAVLRGIAGHPDENQFREERNAIYHVLDDDSRDELFEDLHTRWFEVLGLQKPLRQVLTLWPILTSETERCMLIKAPSHKQMGAELYVSSSGNSAPNSPRRAILIQLTPELLTQTQLLFTFLRRELLHVADMIDPEFGYQPHLPSSEAGPVYDRLVQERYRVLWDMTIDGRLLRSGWLPELVKEEHRASFRTAFPGQPKEQSIVFSFFFDNWPHTHQELLSFARAPESWFIRQNPAETNKGQCSLCHFPSFHLIDVGTSLAPAVIDRIQGDYPNWSPDLRVCRQCADLYEQHSVGT